MSSPRFAPITSDLFARKGDAAPSVAAKLFWTRQPPLAPPRVEAASLKKVETVAPDAMLATPDVLAVEPATPHGDGVQPPLPPADGKPHRMMVTLTPGEYEKLGIAAVKKNMTRHQLVRLALDMHLAQLTREYGGCRCMAGTCDNGCGAT